MKRICRYFVQGIGPGNERTFKLLFKDVGTILTNLSLSLSLSLSLPPSPSHTHSLTHTYIHARAHTYVTTQLVRVTLIRSKGVSNILKARLFTTLKITDINNKTQQQQQKMERGGGGQGLQISILKFSQQKISTNVDEGSMA